MSGITYRQLFESLTPEQMDQNISIYDVGMDEHYGVVELVTTTDACNVLDPGHAVLRF
jgi:hypothetical protein